MAAVLTIALLGGGCGITNQMESPTAEAEKQARLLVRRGPLPAALTMADGQRIETREAWLDRRRPELLALFREHVYGRNAIERPTMLGFEVVAENPDALDGTAVGRRVRIWYSNDGVSEGAFELQVYYPKSRAPAGCFLLIANREREIITQAELRPTGFWPVRALTERGYATAAFHYGDVAADSATECFGSGVFKILGPAERAGDAWGAVAAWAWGASRALDFLATESELAGVPLAVVGHSRGGKAALWCGAQDRRVALTISNESGSTGAAVARWKRGETVAAITRRFPHWFAPNYARYADNETALPVDQHLLLALMAPRLVYVASAQADAWADPEAEFAACVEAGPVYALFGRKGVGREAMPKIGAPRRAGAIGYHVRAGGHDLTRTDWGHFMDFADRHFANATRR